MGIITNLNDQRSELQKRIAADLDAKAKSKSKVVRRSRKVDLEPEDLDGVEDSAYIEGYEKSRTLNLNRTWLILISVAVFAVVLIAVLAMAG
jgi:hypothetical protein